ncbi:unnamed protein product [Boreogadus saida]
MLLNLFYNFQTATLPNGRYICETHRLGLTSGSKIFAVADCTAAPEPQEHIDPTTSSLAPAAVWPPGGIAGTVVGIAVVIAVVIALVCCRKKENRTHPGLSLQEAPSPRGSQPRLRFSPYHTPPPSRRPLTSGPPAPPRVWTQRGKRLRAGAGRLDHL